jgi:hypothetical protein
VSQKVDVISMPWTFKESKEDMYFRSLQVEINAALDARILLLCPNSDISSMTEVEYPSSLDHRILRIGAATIDGRLLGPRVGVEDLNFIVPGDKVLSPQDLKTLPEGVEEIMGSSVATALASGLVAMILHCVRLAAMQAELLETQSGTLPLNTVTAVDFQRIKDSDGMNRVLKVIGLDEELQKFIEVWRLFDEPVRNLESLDGGMTDLEVIAKLARDLVK